MSALVSFMSHDATSHAGFGIVSLDVSVGTLLLHTHTHTHTHTQQTINQRRKWQHKCSYIGMIGLS